MLHTAARRLIGPVMPTGSCVLSRGMTVDGLKGFKEAEKTMEDLHFSKEDEVLLAKLLSKVQLQANAADPQGAVGARAAELAELSPVVKKYNITRDDVEKLIKWKHTQY